MNVCLMQSGLNCQSCRRGNKNKIGLFSDKKMKNILILNYVCSFHKRKMSILKITILYSNF